MENYFAYYGLPERYTLDLANLRQLYLERARSEHPDYHRQGNATDQAQHLDESARNNEAYRTLRDPRLRLLHLLTLAGLMNPAGENLTDRRPDPAFMMDIMELNEEAESLPADQLDAIIERVESEQNALEQQTQQLMARFDAEADTHTRSTLLHEVLLIYLKQQYWQRLKNLVDSRRLS
jgi:molecular chaperone HscB